MWESGNSTDTEEEINKVIEASMRDVSISSIKTQDSIEMNSINVGLEDEEDKEMENELRRSLNGGESRAPLPPFLNLKDTQIVILESLNAPRKKLEIKALHEVLNNIHKIAEDFQIWRKLD
jgi:hypothetical protein